MSQHNVKQFSEHISSESKNISLTTGNVLFKFLTMFSKKIDKMNNEIDNISNKMDNISDKIDLNNDIIESHLERISGKKRKFNELNQNEELEVNINFEEASSEWRKNKNYLGKGLFEYKKTYRISKK